MVSPLAAAAAGPPWLGWAAGLLPAAHLRLSTALLAARPGRFERQRAHQWEEGWGGVLHELQVERGARTGACMARSVAQGLVPSADARSCLPFPHRAGTYGPFSAP